VAGQGLADVEAQRTDGGNGGDGDALRDAPHPAQRVVSATPRGAVAHSFTFWSCVCHAIYATDRF
jgi:hypothetical protein